MFLSHEHRNLYSISLTQSAQVRLIAPVLKASFPPLSNWPVRRFLSAYPYLDETGKTQAILEIMGALWPSQTELLVFKRYESFMRAIGRRDHFIHQFEVFLLGWFIFCALIGRTQSKQLEIESLAPLDPEVFFKIWLLAAMGHDLGYPLQETPEIIEELSILHNDLNLKETARFYNLISKLAKNEDGQQPLLMQDLLNEKGGEIAQQIIIGIRQTLRITQSESQTIGDRLTNSANNHGYLSALLFGEKLMNHFAPLGSFDEETNGDLQALWQYRLLLAAIALHHLKKQHRKIIEKINFSANPFAYLLFISDNLQEWTRHPGVQPGKTDPITFLTDCKTQRSNIILTFVTRHDYWQDEVVRTTEKGIKNANQRLRWPQGSASSLKLQVNYLFNTDKIKKKTIFLPI